MKPGLFEGMMKAITCFEIGISELRGTRKLGQNKKADEREGALAGLEAAGSAEIVALMREEFARP